MSIESKLSKIGKILDAVVAKSRKAISFISDERHNKYVHTSGVNSPYTVLIFDSFVAFLSIFISIHLRIGMDFLEYSPIYITKNMFVFALVSSSVFLWLQTYQAFWKHTSVEDMMPIFFSVILSNIIFFPLMLLMNQEDFLPHSVLIINVFVLSFMLFIPRFLAKMIYNQRIKKMKKFDNHVKNQLASSPPVLLIGNNESVDLFLREVIINDEVAFNFEPVGILTLNHTDIGRSIKGVPIVGEVKELRMVLKELESVGVSPKQLVITEKALPENAKKFLQHYVQENGLLLMHVIHQYTFNTTLE
ncbi:hypothetical protein FACS1894113_2730 [Alphaproteobacteria bacterium]|nr:hypothetical protein FACS1894113_2730 [Alphaproteobacteria bacterium]